MAGDYGAPLPLSPQASTSWQSSNGYTWGAAFSAFGFSGSVTAEWSSGNTNTVYNTAPEGSNVTVVGYPHGSNHDIIYVTNSNY